MRPTDQVKRQLLFKRQFVTDSFQEKGMPHCQGPHGEAPGSVRRQRTLGVNVGNSLHVVSRGGMCVAG